MTDQEHLAAIAKLREPMACGHPKACWVEKYDCGASHNRAPEADYCTACAHEAAALTLFVQQVAATFEEIGCSCGEGDRSDAHAVDCSLHVAKMILSRVPAPNAIAEHDAALRLEVQRDGHFEASQAFVAALDKHAPPEPNRWRQTWPADVIVDAAFAKLQAENAGLLATLRALFIAGSWVGHIPATESDIGGCDICLAVWEARARLAKSAEAANPEGR